MADMARETAVKALGEVVLRVRDLDKMQEFYETVVGLERLHRIGDTHVFLRVADGYGGHTQIVGLFAERVAPQIEFLERSAPSDRASTLHHVALAIALEDYEPIRARLEGLHLAVRTMNHPWIGWRSIYIPDPEGNVVEFVCHDPALAPPR